MPTPDRHGLIIRLDQARQAIEDILPHIDPAKFVYPGWTMKDLLAHMTGWDDVTIDSLRAHIVGRLPSQAAIHSLDDYNEQTVGSRRNLEYDHVLKEWRLTRQVLRTLIEQMPEDKFLEPVVVPWGDKESVLQLVEIFRDHEDYHIRDIQKWMEHPDHPLKKEGN